MVTNKELQLRREAALPVGIASATHIHIEKAKNAEVWDVEGKRYIDLAAGIAVVNTGHSNTAISQAVIEQVEKFSHTAFQVAPYETYIELAERLNRLAPIDNAKTLLLTTGAEAVENAVKIARHYTKRPGVIAFHGGFHGRTNLTMGLTGKVVPYKSGFGPFSSDIYHVPFPIDFYGITTEQSLKAIEQLFKTDIAPISVAAIIIEPVQGEGGFYQAPKELVAALRSLCDQYGILLIFDEVQSGFARTGRLFAGEYYQQQPDIMTVAKALAGGYPLSGVIGKAEVMDSPDVGGLGGTYGGSPIGCAAAHAVLDEIENKDLCHRSQVIGDTLIHRLKALKEKQPNIPIDYIRGVGGMMAFDFVQLGTNQTSTNQASSNKPSTNKPNTELPGRFVQACREQGVILLTCGQFSNTVRVLAPLTIEDHILDEAITIIESELVKLI